MVEMDLDRRESVRLDGAIGTALDVGIAELREGRRGSRLLRDRSAVGEDELGDRDAFWKLKQLLLEAHESVFDLAEPLDSFLPRDFSEGDRLLLPLIPEVHTPRIAAVLDGCHRFPHAKRMPMQL
jgi:hypothetical protein